MSRPYRPSNGSEGDWFMEAWCSRCTKDMMECAIIGLSMMVGTEDPEYPKELTYDEKGKPCCTAFKDQEEARKKAETNRILGIVPTEIHPGQMEWPL